MQDLLDSALARIGAAQTGDELEAVRVEVLGRKGVLAQLSKDMGKLLPDERSPAANSSTLPNWRSNPLTMKRIRLRPRGSR